MSDSNVVTPSLQHKAPLPFVGQKRFFLKHFRQVIDEHIPDNGEGWTIIDVFGGSGLLSNNAKYLKPAATVIFNDFDNYCERLKHVDDSNRLRRQLMDVLSDYPRQTLLDKNVKNQVIAVLKDFEGHIDMRVVSTWLLFAGKHAVSLDELYASHLYNSLRRTDFPAVDDYLTGVDIVCESYDTLIPQYANQPKTLLVFDPPYVNTQQGAYAQKEYFGMVQFLKLMQCVRPPYIFFSSTRSELPAYLDFLREHDSRAWQRVGNYETISLKAQMNKNSSYEDHMIYRFQ